MKNRAPTNMLKWPNHHPAKMHLSNLAIKIILAYSAMNIKANRPPPYSTLNPETSSLSLSAKSNGLRFVPVAAPLY
jgi:hypothetical protein